MENNINTYLTQNEYKKYIILSIVSLFFNKHNLSTNLVIEEITLNYTLLSYCASKSRRFST